MKKKSVKPKKGFTQAQRIALALAFIGEHRELFEKWLSERNIVIKEDGEYE